MPRAFLASSAPHAARRPAAPGRAFRPTGPGLRSGWAVGWMGGAWLWCRWRMLATTMAQGKLGDRVDILFANGCCTAPGSMGTRRAQPDQIGAQAIDTGGKAALGDLRQRFVVEGNARQCTACCLATLTQRLLLALPLGAELLRITVEIQASTDDLAAFGRCGVTTEGDVQAKAIEQLRTQLALFRVHGADQHELRRMPMGNTVALNQIGAAGGHVEQQVDEVIGQQIHFIDVEHAAVSLGQYAGENCARPSLRAASRSRVPTRRSSVAPRGKVTNWPLASRSARPRARVDLAMPRGPSISTPPIFGSMAVRYRASFRSSAPTTAESGKWGCRSSSSTQSWSVVQWHACPCGSEPARESGLSVNDDVDCAGLFASRPRSSAGYCALAVFFYIQQQIFQGFAILHPVLSTSPAVALRAYARSCRARHGGYARARNPEYPGRADRHRPATRTGDRRSSRVVASKANRLSTVAASSNAPL